MNTTDIIAALENCDYARLAEIRKALDARTDTIKGELMAQAKAMGLACHDGNGKPRKPRATKQHDQA